MSKQITDSSSTTEKEETNLESNAPPLESAPPLPPAPGEGRMTMPLLFAIFSVTIGGSFQFGYHVGCINAPQKHISSWYNESHTYLHPDSDLSDENIQLLWSITVGIFAIGGCIGGLLSGIFADKFGRKNGLLFHNVFVLLAIALMSTAKLLQCYYLIIVGRLIIGFSSGLASSLVPMYLTEVSPLNLRGTLGSSNQLILTLGILVSQIMGYVFGSEELWPYIFVFAAIPSLLQVATLPFVPESPKYNVVVKGKIEQAERDLMKLRQRPEVEAEIQAIKEEAEAASKEKKATIGSLMFKPLRWPTFIAVMMMFSQQLSGINAVMFYSTQIFEGAGLKGNEPLFATIAMGFVNLLMAVVSVWLVDHPKFGRRSLHLAGLTGMLFSSILIVMTLSITHQVTAVKDWLQYYTIIFVILFVCAFAVGPGPIPWFFVAEIFQSSARGAASSVSCLANWSANFIVGSSFPFINDLLGEYTFLIFVVFLVIFIGFTWKFVPETKGKTVEEINQALGNTGGTAIRYSEINRENMDEE